MLLNPFRLLRRMLGRVKRATWDATGTLRDFLAYAWIQHRHAARRLDGPAIRLSHINFKNAHYLEKAMLCGYDRTPELDQCYASLVRYLDSPAGPEDDCYLYLRKLAHEYEHYPSGFKCFMRDTQSSRGQNPTRRRCARSSCSAARRAASRPAP